MGLLQQFHYFIAQYRSNCKIGTYHDNVVCRNFRHLYFQALTRIVFVKNIFCIISLVQKSE